MIPTTTQIISLTHPLSMAAKVAEVMLLRGDRLSTLPGHKNLVYVEGMNPDFTLNPDDPDDWNDLRCVIEFFENIPFFSHVARATCEPGTAATFSASSAVNGGVARLQLIQYISACRVGYHRQARLGQIHPALVQVGDMWVHRDANKDQKRTGDLIAKAHGINHHGTKAGFAGKHVGRYSEGCCVGYDWAEHLAFIELMKSDPRYLKNQYFNFDFSLVSGEVVMGVGR